MANQILVAKTSTIQVSFYSDGELSDPDTVEGSIRDVNMNEIDSFIPVNLSTGIWAYDWTPMILGTFYLEFKGTFSDATVDIARELFEVVATVDSLDSPSITLAEDQFITFLTPLSPMYLDVQAVLDVYPDLDPVSVAEYIHIASLESEELLGGNFAISQLVLDFILASTLCSLSKIASIGDYGEESIQLGDLMVKYRSTGGAHLNRGNAGNWCELAMALRTDLLASSANPKSYLKGSSFGNPIPSRQLRDLEK